MRPRQTILLAALVAFGLGTAAAADDRQLLDLRRAEISLREAESNVQQSRALFEEGLISRAELNRIEGQRERAVIDRDQAAMALSSELPSFQVLSAIKRPDSRGGSVVTIRLLPLGAAKPSSAPRQYVVSLEDSSAIIGEPYQQIITIGIASQTVQECSFRLLRDLDEVRVVIVSGNRREEVPLVLQRSSLGAMFRMTCATPSLEGALGRKVDYALVVERFDTGSRTATVVVDGLPEGFRWSVQDAESKATVTGLSFAEGENQRRMNLQVFVPDRVSEGTLGRTLPFQLRLLDDRKSAVGEYDLQLNVVGSPRLVVRADRLLISAFNEEPSVITLRIANTGSQEAPDVRVETTLPIGFVADVKPVTIRSIQPGESAAVQIQLKPTDEAVPGDYSVRVTAFAVLRQLRVESDEQIFRLAYARRGSISIAIILSVAVPVAVSGTFLFWRRRRSAHR